MEYFKKLPAPLSRMFIVVDPMLATGNSASFAIDILKRAGVSGENIVFMALIGVKEGIKVLTDNHPDIKIYIAGLDEKLNEKAYIIPGLGDAGDRLFGTKTELTYD
ncbi:MAG: Uracil phosphoribosyltransferase [Alphaproteobacteria bacterium ADurb.Bin438]|nr:MAG: Uracil phosphoribosyltransferase [Alphaproteobacteria bacterium ADurb.Bin438]